RSSSRPTRGSDLFLQLILPCSLLACSFGSAEGGPLISAAFDESEDPRDSDRTVEREFSGFNDGSFTSNLLGGAGGELEGSGGSGASGDGDGGATQQALVSEFCGDSIRDLILEDCDAGPLGSPACNSVCQVLDFPLVEPPDVAQPPLLREQRVWGEGRHPAAGNSEMQAIAFMDRSEPDATGHVGIQLLDPWGNREATINVAEDAQPAFSAH